MWSKNLNAPIKNSKQFLKLMTYEIPNLSVCGAQSETELSMTMKTCNEFTK